MYYGVDDRYTSTPPPPPPPPPVVSVGVLSLCSGYMFEPRTVYKISNILLSTVNHYTAYTTYSNHNNTGMPLQSYHVFIYYSSSPLR